MDRITAFRGEYAFLSNFYLHTVKLDDVLYRSVEHAYQAAKSLDDRERAVIRLLATAAQAKQRGRHLTLRPDWEAVKVSVMRALLQQKFTNGSVLWYKLMATTGKELVEGNTWGDKYWGCVKGVNGEWYGENWLGNILMEIRDAR